MSEASCPNFQPRAHAGLTGLTMNHYALLEEQVRRARSDDGRLKAYNKTKFARQRETYFGRNSPVVCTVHGSSRVASPMLPYTYSSSTKELPNVVGPAAAKRGGAARLRSSRAAQRKTMKWVTT